jgi:hypothetical protein
MANNNKITIRTIELHKNKNYKVRPNLLPNPLFSSLFENQKIDANRVVGIFYDDEEKSISEINNQSSFNFINTYRSADIDYTSVLETEDTTLEYLPEHHHITEMIANIQRMETEYSDKLNMLDYLVDKLFDIGYAKDIYYFGRASGITVLEGKISPAFGYIIADNADENVQLNLIIRGIPVPMRKTLTSVGTYYFTYPQYLIDTDESVNSIQHIEVLNQGSAVFWKGTSNAFPLYSNSGDYINLRIINKESRNSSLEASDFDDIRDPDIVDPAWNS